jgi:TetR/AcrR family transcriptional regulator, transcriptional repressor for nem operon
MLSKRKNGTERQRRDSERTRDLLLQAAFQEVYGSGFQHADLDRIPAATGVTKGALYYHFESKAALGYAIVDEVIAGLMRDRWLRPLRGSADPIETLISVLERTSVRPEDVRRGCPLNNLAQEMSTLDEGFQRRLARVFREWNEGIASALAKGQSEGTVRRDLDTREGARFLIAAYEGYLSLAKNAQDVGMLKAGIRNIIYWLRSLRRTNKRLGRGKHKESRVI